MTLARPKTILFTWELGAGWGHIAPHIELMRHLVERGRRVMFALRDVTYADRLLGPIGVQYVQAPIQHTKVLDPIDTPYHYAHILHNVGFANPDSLYGLVRSWHTLFDVLQPDLVIADHSPTALLASRLRSHTTVATGTGFALPPDISPLPVLRRTSVQNISRLHTEERQVLDNINAALGRFGAKSVNRVSEVVAAFPAIFRTFKELDHYGARPNVKYWGSWESSRGANPEWPVGNRPRIFAYLKPFKEINGILDALARLGAPTLIYANVDRVTKERYSSPTLRFSPVPLDMKRIGTECDIAILNSNHATLADILLAGKPVLLLPLTLEQYVLTERIEKIGAGLRLAPGNTEAYVETLRTLIEQRSYKDAALGFAARYSTVDREEQAIELVTYVEQMLA